MKVKVRPQQIWYFKNEERTNKIKEETKRVLYSADISIIYSAMLQQLRK